MFSISVRCLSHYVEDKYDSHRPNGLNFKWLLYHNDLFEFTKGNAHLRTIISGFQEIENPKEESKDGKLVQRRR